MSKDTEKEQNNQYYDDDYYYDYEGDEDYLIGRALGGIKEDPASVRSRPRRTPVSKLQLSDEANIPKPPENLVKKPDEKAFTESKKKKTQRINQISKSIEELFKQMNAENELFKELKAKREERAKIRNKLNMDNKEGEEGELLAEFKSFSKYKFSANPEVIQEQINEIKESLSFGDLSANEEKTLNEKKAILGEYYAVLKKYRVYRDKVQSSIKDELKVINGEIAEIQKKIDAKKSKEEKKEDPKNDPARNQIKFQIQKLREERNELYQKRKEEETNYYKQVDEYNEQQDLLDYIQRAKEQINWLHQKEERQKKREKAEEKEKKRKEKEEQKNPKQAEVESVLHIPKIYDKNIKDLEYLEAYFRKKELKGPATAPQETQKGDHLTTLADQITDNSKADPKKQELKERPKEKDLGISLQTSVPAKKKKGKAPKINQVSSEILIMDFEIIQKINENGLTAPKKEEDLPKFLEELAKKKEKLIAENKEETNS